ncbi:hypothetical protein M8J77_023850 [Diaphorina citri]|nr:hypothetical protein M8J77_023850 [Diaphorina citri]
MTGTSVAAWLGALNLNPEKKKETFKFFTVKKKKTHQTRLVVIGLIHDPVIWCIGSRDSGSTVAPSIGLTVNLLLASHQHTLGINNLNNSSTLH